MVAEIADVRALVHAPCAEHEARRTQFIAALYQRHRRSLLWYLTRLIPNRADAEEVAQEAFVRLLGATHLETDASRARNYLFATATNLARDNYRRRSARAEGAHVALDDLQLEADEPDPTRSLDAERGCRIVASALRSLQPRPRQAFLMYVQEELTYERIALKLGVSKKTIERDIALTIALCRSRLARWAEA
ncbi:MAG TPA: RNA polymerase sigma factor [Gammaproteobacteria bacterium]|nr:RNA polymerase sigma factor [Gammaproteobacteria bacterium]